VLVNTAVGEVKHIDVFGRVRHHRRHVAGADAEPQSSDEEDNFTNISMVALISRAVTVHYQYVSTR